MRPNPIFVAAAGFAMVGACTVKTEDNTTDNAGTTATPASENAAQPNDNAAGTDTLGNQLNQLNESDAAAANEETNPNE